MYGPRVATLENQKEKEKKGKQSDVETAQNINLIIFQYKTLMIWAKHTYSFWKAKHEALYVLAGLIRSLLRKAR